MINNDKENEWLSTYLYYGEPLDIFIVNAVAPFVQSVLQQGLSTQYFFIRYWENGPHIRLRFKAQGNNLIEELKLRVIDFFAIYFEKYPSSRLGYISGINIAANNSYVFEEYTPETSRYGGKLALEVSEHQFQYSSQACLTLLSENKNQWDVETAIGLAIQLHISLVHSMCYTKSEAKIFFELLSISLEPYLTYSFKKEYNEENLHKLFSIHFEAVKDSIIPFINEFWNLLDQGFIFNELWMNNWLTGMKSVYNGLDRLFVTGKIECPPIEYLKNAYGNAKPEMSYILSSYIHMTNNRLGIRNDQEPYIAFIIANSLYTAT